MKFRLTFCILVFSFTTSIAQEKFTISGSVKDKKTGEEIIAAMVIDKTTGKKAETNEYGFFSLTLEKGKHTLLFSIFTYKPFEMEVDLTSNQKLVVELTPDEKELEEVEITDKREETMQEKNMGVMTMDMKKIKEIPAIFGEVDIMKTVQLLPGVQSAGEGNAGFNVRGGASDQNLILLDEATVYNASHLFGFFSVFNPDAIKDLDLYKGGIPARYGGRLSSLLDIRMKDGNSKRFSMSGGLGLIASRLTIESPIFKEKGSFIISGRRTYADLFLKLSKKEDLKNTKLFFYDLNAKGNYRIGEKDRIFISGYFGRDVLDLAGLFGFDWGNATGTLRWNHIYNPKLFSNVTLIYSNFDYGIKIDLSETQNFKVQSGIDDIGLKADYSWYPNPNHTVYYGIQSTYHIFQPGEFKPLRETSIFIADALPQKYALESSAYLDHKWEIDPRFTIRYGLRATRFDAMGKSKEYTFHRDIANELIIDDTTEYAAGKIIKTYYGLEPRASASFSVNEKIAIKATYDHTYQFLHQVSNSATTLPTDLWMPSGMHIKPQINDQVALGYFHQPFSGFEYSVETYYRWMNNQIDYRDNALLIFNELVEAELLFGKGYSYGAEWMISKTTGKFTGWISYTLAWTKRKIDQINNGEAYPVKNDRRHNLSVTGTYKIRPRLSLAGVFIFATGNAVTFPSGKYVFDGEVIDFYAERNGYRMPPYHRLDLSVTIDGKKKEGKRLESSWNFSVFNAYLRSNAFGIVFEEKKDENGIGTGQTVAKQITLFKIVPSITWNFKF
ncbi:MAG: carboxypeptidase-like regulatory domain-containing protein [Flavobacteriales bacterium]